MVATRGAERPGSGGLSPVMWGPRSTKPTGTEEDHRGGGRARNALWPTGTDAPASGDAACQPGRAAGPQERILQRTVEQFVDLASMVQILDSPVPQLVEQLADVLVRVDVLVKKHEEEEVRRWRGRI